MIGEPTLSGVTFRSLLLLSLLPLKNLGEGMRRQGDVRPFTSLSRAGADFERSIGGQAKAGCRVRTDTSGSGGTRPSFGPKGIESDKKESVLGEMRTPRPTDREGTISPFSFCFWGVGGIWFNRGIVLGKNDIGARGCGEANFTGAFVVDERPFRGEDGISLPFPLLSMVGEAGDNREGVDFGSFDG